MVSRSLHVYASEYLLPVQVLLPSHLLHRKRHNQQEPYYADGVVNARLVIASGTICLQNRVPMRACRGRSEIMALEPATAIFGKRETLIGHGSKTKTKTNSTLKPKSTSVVGPAYVI